MSLGGQVMPRGLRVLLLAVLAWVLVVLAAWVLLSLFG